MTRKDFRQLDFKLDSIGRLIKLDDIDYKWMLLISYAWNTRFPSPSIYVDEGYTPHPIRKGLGIRQAFNKIIDEQFDDININLNVTGYFTLGPAGKYADVIGNVGDRQIDVRCHFGCTAQAYRPIDPFSIKNHMFYIDYGIESFLLAVFKKKDW